MKMLWGLHLLWCLSSICSSSPLSRKTLISQLFSMDEPGGVRADLSAAAAAEARICVRLPLGTFCLVFMTREAAERETLKGRLALNTESSLPPPPLSPLSLSPAGGALQRGGAAVSLSFSPHTPLSPSLPLRL